MEISRRQFGTGAATLAVGASLMAWPGLEGCSTSWTTTLENDLPELVNMATSVLSIIALATGNGTLVASSGTIMTEATQVLQASLTTLQDAVTAYNGGKGSGSVAAISDALQAVAMDAQKVIAALSAAGVKVPPNIQTSIVAAIGLMVSIVSSIQLVIPGAKVPATVGLTAKMAAQEAAAKTPPPTASQIRTGYNSVLVLNGFAVYQIR